MKRVFQIIGLLSLAFFSFYVTEKTTTVFENMDNIMIQIKDNSYKYNIDSVDAVILDNTIIPGKYGKVVNIKKSYSKMKKYGLYDENMYVYNFIKPNVSLSDNKDKYIISGNKESRNIGLIFIIKDDIYNLIDLLDYNNIKATLFVDDNWFQKNNDLVIELINKGFIIGNLSHNLDYNDSSFGWMDTIIKSLTKQKQGYCYYTDNIDTLKVCSGRNNYTIKPIEINNNYLYEVKKNLNNGVMLSFNLNNKLIKELDSIIKYIKGKGYNIVDVNNLLSEKNLK